MSSPSRSPRTSGKKIKVVVHNGDKDEELYFPSTYKASLYLKVTPSMLNSTLSGNGGLHKKTIPDNVDVSIIQCIPEGGVVKVSKPAMYMCHICNKTVKACSKWAHNSTLSHQTKISN
jgi:hypothetical protein